MRIRIPWLRYREEIEGWWEHRVSSESKKEKTKGNVIRYVPLQTLEAALVLILRTTKLRREEAIRGMWSVFIPDHAYLQLTLT